MKSKWLLVLAATLVVACQKPAPPPGPAASTTTGKVVTNDVKVVPEKEQASPAVKEDDTAANTEKAVADKTVADKTEAATAEPAVGANEQILGLVSGFNEEMQKWSVAMRGASSQEERQSMMTERPDSAPVYEKIKAVMDASNDPEVRLNGLLVSASTLRAPEAIKELFRDHSTNENVLPMIMSIGRIVPPDQAAEILETLVSGEENTPAKGAALFSLAQVAQNSDSDKAEKYLTQISTDFADLEINGQKLVDMAKPMLFEIQHLGIGKEAPDIEGTDLDGVAFKLSDYRGKVVVIDFWGDW